MRKLKLLLGSLLLVLAFKLTPITYNLEVTDLDRHVWKHDLLVFVLDNVADSNDTVVINIDSHGGVVLSTLDIVNSILKTEATTISNIKTGAFSGGAVIAMSTDYVTGEYYSSILFHKARYYSMSGRATIVDNLIVDKFIAEKVYPILTDKEIESFELGEDVELTTEDLVNRIKNL